ncbi:hypothetical protein D7B24_003205 [Verticillium nonalfalfae]|uniref:Cupin type-2 domain-containing protein n=1 Tax=Verticillium nonalfalfae TaxID=1051616 RepID=A0A3M9YGR3_9PEZI|nr:uncharacterized protein D7B24_003205 [Verticillium nonalfalfae]RNJ59112.1 hypothetical protein D7B24_003205 [Verticillium nonalfalfae]
MADSNPRATALPPPVYHLTSHDPETGRSVFKSQPLEAEPDNKIPQTTLWHLHTTTTFPANLNDEVDLEEHYANNVPSMNTLHKSGGTVCRIVDFAPGNIPFMHRTSSLDYGVVLQGKIEYFLDDGASRVFGPGEVVIQRGVMHGWKTAGDEPVRMLFVLSDAQPVEVAGETKGTYLPLDKMPESTRKAMGG